MTKKLALNPAFVASPSSPQAVLTKGFNRGESEAGENNASIPEQRLAGQDHGQREPGAVHADAASAPSGTARPKPGQGSGLSEAVTQDALSAASGGLQSATLECRDIRRVLVDILERLAEASDACDPRYEEHPGHLQALSNEARLVIAEARGEV
jgi:hypothetical protein